MLSEFLPSSLKADKKITAAAEALDIELEKLSAAIKNVLHLPRLDELESDILDHLAWQYHVDKYSSDFDLNVKRKMIRESIYLHRIKGTKAAVLLALKAFSERPEISEWFEYDGEPYFFRLTLRDLKDVGDDGETLFQVINDAKNVRSWLEQVTFDYSLDDVESYLKVGTHEAEGGEHLTKLDFELETIDSNLHAAHLEVDESDELTNFTVEPIDSSLKVGMHEAAGGFELTKADFTPADLKIRAGFHEVDEGEEVTAADISDDDYYFLLFVEPIEEGDSMKVNIELYLKAPDGKKYKHVIHYVSPDASPARVKEFVNALNSLTKNDLQEIWRVITEYLDGDEEITAAEIDEIIDGNYKNVEVSDGITEQEIEDILNETYENADVDSLSKSDIDDILSSWDSTE